MHSLLTEILKSQKIETINGSTISLASSIDEDEVSFIQNIITENKFKKSIEVGCAMGISSLAICEAIKKNGDDGQHIIIDPFQSTDWESIGINNLKKAQFANYTHYEEKSEFMLPKLVNENVKVDFAFIDGWHTFDHTLIDFFYVNRMLNVGGIVIIDDVQMAAVNKVMRFIQTYPCYQFVGSVTQATTGSRKITEGIKSVIKAFSKLTGKRLSSELFGSSVLKNDESLGLNSSMVALKKIGEDTRPWNWHQNF